MLRGYRSFCPSHLEGESCAKDTSQEDIVFTEEKAKDDVSMLNNIVLLEEPACRDRSKPENTSVSKIDSRIGVNQLYTYACHYDS